MSDPKIQTTIPRPLRLIPWRLLALINADAPTPPEASGAAMQKDGTHG
jgi:hypothetical protein